MRDAPLTKHQVEALAATYSATLCGDGWILKGSSRIWGVAPMAIYALAHKELLLVQRRPHCTRARLTPKGRALVEADPARFGLKERT